MIGYLLRGVELLELFTFLTCGTYLVRGYRHVLPKPLLTAGNCYLAALFAISLGIGLNATQQVAISPGLVLVAFLMAPPAVVVAAVTVNAVRHGTRRLP